MSFFRIFGAAVIGAFIALAPFIAHAAERGETDSPPPPPKRDLSFRASVGGYDDLDATTGGANLGVSALYRHDLFLLGGIAEYGAALFDYSYIAVAPAAGIALPVPSWARAEILLTTGVHDYSGVGKAFFGNDPGASATLPFAGARVYAGVELGGHAFRFTAGVASWVEADLFRHDVTYSYRDTFLTPSDETVTRSVGVSRASLALLLGGTFGI